MSQFLRVCLVLCLGMLLAGKTLAQPTLHTTVRPSCQAYANGRIELVVQGAAPFQFQWSNGSQEQNQENLPPGSYSVVVTDASGRQANRTLQVKALSSLKVEATVQPGQVTASTMGGTAPYTYHWVNLGTSQKKTAPQASVQLPKGNYLLVVEDGNGCSHSCQFKVPN